MYKTIIEVKKNELEKAVAHFKEESIKIRTGRANASMVENLLVDYYGAKTPLVQMASINVPEPRTIAIQPWDKGALAGIETAIRESDLGLNPMNDGQLIRLSIPPLTEERRQEMVKVLNKKAEESRITLRNIREDVLREIQDAEKAGKISEDDKFRGKDELQKVIDEYNGKIDEIREKKEKDIMTV